MKGRFPANLLVSDDILNDGKIRKGGGGLKHKYPIWGKGKYCPQHQPLDSGSYSRYFDLDAWWEEKQREK